ncbi:tryptophan synthase subunit beta [Acidaminobacter sp. JC074]|uniref:tryptophan synthase subunit beta n=1 Tax=Acidaminobacter sp. JC074 TaxID=2530199 RepID=UPI001F0E2A2D|nr:tryptophan synthase subunit beta [Acidaminobacter sp. JC074]MCH4889977.1 tryptophan synthase subunit beta [Acidaminobacter sp. JC074]
MLKRYFGKYGGQFVSEALIPPLNQLEGDFKKCINDEDFVNEYNTLLAHYVGRETPLYYASRLTDHYGGPKIYLKREDLNHTGAHKINNALGQALIAKYQGKKHIIAETGAGQHGVATATACALLNLECTVFMGEIDVKRQAANVKRIQLLGAKVVAVKSGSRVLKDATNEAIRYWINHQEETFYIIGSAIGPHPYPSIVKYFQSIIGRETKKQILELEGKLPDKIIACVGGGSNAIGMFNDFVDTGSSLIGVEASGKGIDTFETAATLSLGKTGVLHGSHMYLLQDENGNVQEAYSISAGLDYPGIGPEHAYLKDIGRVRYEAISDIEAVNAFKLLTRLEGIIPALESSHAVAQVEKEVLGMTENESIVICLSGRGDKDMDTILKESELC